MHSGRINKGLAALPMRRIARTIITTIVFGLVQVAIPSTSYALLAQPTQKSADALAGSTGCESDITSSAYTTSTADGDCIVTFNGGATGSTTSHTWVAPANVQDLTFLLVAGGGSGGTGGPYSNEAGGGGAGGLILKRISVTPGTSYSISIGGGGAGNSTGGTNGVNSTAFGYTTLGGGHGGGGISTGFSDATAGGSGGGGAHNMRAGGAGNQRSTNTYGRGFDGATPGIGSSGAGGGGAGGPGAASYSDTSGTHGGDGGKAFQSSISGTATYYAGGGAGTSNGTYPTQFGVGGNGVGGNGDGSNGAANTGSGGGGKLGTSGVAGGNGAAGILIIRWTPTGFTNSLRMFVKNDAGATASTTFTNAGKFYTSCSNTEENFPYIGETGASHDWGSDAAGGSPVGCNADGFTLYATGWIKAPASSFHIFTKSDDGSRIDINGTTYVNFRGDQGAYIQPSAAGTDNLVSGLITGSWYKIDTWMHENGGGTNHQLFYSLDGTAAGAMVLPSSNLTYRFPSTIQTFGVSNLTTRGVASTLSAALDTTTAKIYNDAGNSILSRSGTFTFIDSGTTPSNCATFSVNSNGASTCSWAPNLQGTRSLTLSFNSTDTLGINSTQLFYASTYSPQTSVVQLSVTVANAPGGDTDTALAFNGTTQYAYAPDADAFDITGAITMEAWVRPTAVPANGSYGMVAQKSGAYELMMGNSGGVTTWYYGLWGSSAWSGVSSNIPVVLNEWHHIAFTRDSGSNTVNFYYDGVLVRSDGGADTAGTGNIANSTYPFAVGIRYTNGNPSGDTFTGTIDQVAVFNTVRTQTNVQSDMKTYIDTTTSGLVAYYDFNEGSGTQLYNRLSTSNSLTDLTLVSSPTWSDVKVVDTTTFPAYTIVKFPRTYITKIGGWKVPSQVSRAYALVVAGGGGGGGGLNGGGGGAGGFIESLVTLTPNAVQSVTVGLGGIGYLTGGQISVVPSNGTDSVAFGFSATGGGYGASELYSPNSHYAANSGGSGGGGSWGNNSANYAGKSGTNNQGFAGGNSGSLSSTYAGAGGGGAGSIGGNATAGNGGNGGTGKFSLLLSETLAGGGGGGCRNGSNVSCTGGTAFNGGGSAASGNGLPNTTNGAKSGTANTGGGGGGGVIQNTNADGKGGSGGSGIVAIRWITASKPTYTPPAVTYLDVGQTETFTVNVASDSATVNLTRTFRWESTTGGSNGTFTKIKEGTGSANAYFSWIPTDTSTSGSSYLYRLIVTDSDTAGLFITDSSTAYAVIYPAIKVVGAVKINKAINIAKNETLTITLGSSGYKATFAPLISGISLDTSTVSSGNVVIKVQDSMTVGTYLETLTVTDSVSASVDIPLTINVIAPPLLTNTGEIVTNGQVFNVDFSSTASYSEATGTIVDISGSNKSVTAAAGLTFSRSNSGIASLNGSSQYLQYTNLPRIKQWTIEAFVRLDSAVPAAGGFIVTTGGTNATNYTLSVDQSRTVNVGYQSGGYWKSYRTVSPSVLTVGVWTHVVGLWDGSEMQIYFNGVKQTGGTYINVAAGPDAPASDSAYNLAYINHAPNTANYIDQSLGFVRIYNRGLTASEILQNYNATKLRFDSSKTSRLLPSKKYGTVGVDSLTATAGLETKTITLAVGDRSGIDWDTSTVGQLNLATQETLSVGSYYDTMTVTDQLGQSTYLPIKMTVTKADTLTVQVRNPVTMVYTGSVPTTFPTVTVTGLVSTDSATASLLYSNPSGSGPSWSYAAVTETTTVPIDVETYTVKASTPVFTSGALSNYQGFTTETSTIKITQAYQNKLTINLYGAVAGSSFTLQVTGGSGTGAVTETITANSSAVNCRFTSYHVLANDTPSNDQKACNIALTKAASRNYFVETMAATVYFMVYLNNQPTNQVGGGTVIALNGATYLETSTVTPPTITTLSTLTLSLSGGGTFTINGSGLAGAVTVKFYRNKIVSITNNANANFIDIPVTSIRDVGATTGRIVIITAAGEAVSNDTLVVNP